MAHNANVSTEVYDPFSDEAVKEKYTYNQQQKAGKLSRQINHKLNYGLAIYAQALLKVNALNRELTEMGLPPVQIKKPDFSDPEKLKELAKLSAYKPAVPID
jgi:hypothetical protein